MASPAAGLSQRGWDWICWRGVERPTSSPGWELPGRSPLPAAGPSRERTAAQPTSGLPWQPPAPPAGGVCESRRPRCRCLAVPAGRRAHLWGWAEANTNPGKVKGRRPAVALERPAPARACGAGRPAPATKPSLEDHSSGALSSMETSTLGRWSDPSLSSCLFHSEPKQATEEECIHCPRFSKS